MEVSKLMEAPNGGVSVARGYTVKSINVQEQIATLTDGKTIKYDKCLIATGAKPVTLDVFDQAGTKVKEKICSYKTIKDFEELKERVDRSKTIAIVGGGFLGSELACALANLNKGK